MYCCPVRLQSRCAGHLPSALLLGKKVCEHVLLAQNSIRKTACSQPLSGDKLSQLPKSLIHYTLSTAFLFCFLFSWRDSCNIWAHIEASYVILGKCITQMFGFSAYQSEYASPSVGMLCSVLTAVTRKLTLLLSNKFISAFQHPSVFLDFSSEKEKSKMSKSSAFSKGFFYIKMFRLKIVRNHLLLYF